MRLTEELILLMLDEDSGYLEMVPSWDFACVMAGAVIADLALEGRIDTDLDALHVINDAPTGDALLDPTLREISEAQDVSSAQLLDRAEHDSFGGDRDDDARPFGGEGHSRL